MRSSASPGMRITLALLREDVRNATAAETDQSGSFLKGHRIPTDSIRSVRHNGIGSMPIQPLLCSRQVPLTAGAALLFFFSPSAFAPLNGNQP